MLRFDYYDIEISRNQEVFALPGEKKNPAHSEPVLVRLPGELLRGLDALRRQEEDPPTRPEMIRRILQAYIETHPPKA